MLSRNQRPKIDKYDDYLFIVLHFPVFDSAAGRLNTGELDIFVGPGFLITIPNQPLQPVEYLFERCRQKEELRDQLFSRGSGYLLYRIVDDGFDYCFPMLRKIGNKLDALEERDLRGPLRGDRARHLEREAGDHQLPQGDPPAAPGAARPRAGQGPLPGRRRSTSRSTSTTSSTPTSGSGTCSRTTRRWSRRYEDTNESVISHRVNDILRVLTSISVIVLPLTLLASIWGMNVGVPGEGGDTAFWVIVGAMLTLLVGMVTYFRRRGWL